MPVENKCVEVIDERVIDLKNLNISKKEIKFLEQLKNLEKIRIENKKLYIENFCGYLTENILVIPSKIKEFLKENFKENEYDNFKDIFDRAFSIFLNYIIKELAKEDIIYTLSLANFPVDENSISESKIFKLLLLLNKKDELINSLHLILSNPHRKLVKNEEYRRFEDVNTIDENILIDIISNPQFLYRDNNGLIENQYLPIKVLQYKNYETYDTLENRFIKHFLKELEYILSEELKEFLSLKELEEIKEEIEFTLQTDIFSEVGNLNYFPSNSQVLMKKTVYREMFQIYRLLHLSFVPQIFKNLDMALCLKDMATLWEYYVLIKILKILKDIYGSYEVKINLEMKVKGNTMYDYAKFEFKNGLKLYYQKTLKSYSCLQFRPDFLIEKDGKRYIFREQLFIFTNKTRL